MVAGGSTAAATTATAVTSGVGYRYIHTAIDDRTRLVYSEILDDEQAVTAAAFWRRAAVWFAADGITCRTSHHRQRRLLPVRASGPTPATPTGVTRKKTRPRRPQTNGKVERFHRILLEEWAYIRPWTSERQRHAAYDGFIHFYNHHRSHGALGWATPIAPSPLRDNLPAEHS